MSKNKENKLLDVVRFYYSLYKQNEEAYNNSQQSKKGLKEQLTPLLDDGKNSSSQEFKNLAKEYMKIITMYGNEVGFAANKFLNAADVYLKVEEEDLPEDMSKAYVLLKSTEYKPVFSVKNGQFVRNSKQTIPEAPQKEFDFIFDWLRDNLETS